MEWMALNSLTNLVIVSDFIAANSWRLCEKSSISNFPEADFSLSSTNSSNCPICTRSRGSSSLKETFEAEKKQKFREINVAIFKHYKFHAPVKLESLVMGESFAHWTIVWRDTVDIFGNSIVSSEALAATKSLAKDSQVSSSDLTKIIFFRSNFLVPFLFNWSLKVFQSVIRQFWNNNFVCSCSYFFVHTVEVWQCLNFAAIWILRESNCCKFSVAKYYTLIVVQTMDFNHSQFFKDKIYHTFKMSQLDSFT